MSKPGRSARTFTSPTPGVLMSTPKDLLIVALQDGGPVTQGELSLGLAAAELIDLLQVPVAELDRPHTRS
ncbi:MULTISPECIES: hypothetical protein [unclassified Streptomyces]|uniref:hypothetical protein n=1 Tax=unclassified Streptomyces TaxID=2593676 RepID=UPI0037F9BD39